MHNSKNNKYSKNKNNKPQLAKAPNSSKSLIIETSELKKDSNKREQETPFLEKIQKIIKGKSNTFSELIINSDLSIETRVALIKNGILEKFNIERSGDRHEVGAIFKGKVQNLEPGLKAAFVDIGQSKNAFLHYWDIIPSKNDKTIELVKNNKSKKQIKNEKVSLNKIPDLYPIGSEIIVQITKGKIGTKGPRTTTNLSLAGRFLVLNPFSGTIGISRKIEDKNERNRLKKILRNITLPEGMGVIIRTAGEGKKQRYFVRDLEILKKRWENISQRIDKSKSPTCVYVEPDLIGRTVRDFLTEDIDRIVVDKMENFEKITSQVAKISPRSKSKITYYSEEAPIFEKYKIEEQINQTFSRNVLLPSGGEIVIEETEALISIDVNTGSHKNSEKDGKNFILAVNLEAALEISRQIKLRNLGGLVIVDFIDMKFKRDRNTVYQRMRKLALDDKAKTHILPISNFGIMQMTRQRHSESNSSSIFMPCPYCSNSGKIKSVKSITIELQRKLLYLVRKTRNKEGIEKEIIINVILHPDCLSELKQSNEQVLIDIEKHYGARIKFQSNPEYHIEYYNITNIS